MILKALYLILPGVFANMAPVLCKKIPFLNYPVDLNKRWGGKPVFGPHKTYRGFFFGILFAMVIVLFQRFLFQYSMFRNISLINYATARPFLLGFLMGFGVLFGDLVKSFFKRRLGIKPGASWFPFDQLDALAGGLVFTSLMYVPPLNMIFFLFIAVPLLSLATNYLAFYLRLKETKR